MVVPGQFKWGDILISPNGNWETDYLDRVSSIIEPTPLKGKFMHQIVLSKVKFNSYNLHYKKPIFNKLYSEWKPILESNEMLKSKIVLCSYDEYILQDNSTGGKSKKRIKKNIVKNNTKRKKNIVKNNTKRNKKYRKK